MKLSTKAPIATILILSTGVPEQVRCFTAPRISRVVTNRLPSTALGTFSMDPSSMTAAIGTFYETQPYLSAFLTCSFKASAADLVAQRQTPAVQAEKTENDKMNIDVPRNLAFLLYGGLYQGCVQEFIYNNVFPTIFGTDTTPITVLEQVAFDLLGLTPFLCLPVAYLVKAGIHEDQTLQEGLEKYKSHVETEGLLFKYWALWLPVQTLTFSVIPHHFRIAFIALVSFFWLMILSTISATDTEEKSTA